MIDRDGVLGKRIVGDATACLVDDVAVGLVVGFVNAQHPLVDERLDGAGGLPVVRLPEPGPAGGFRRGTVFGGLRYRRRKRSL